MAFLDLSHTIEHGMTTYPGLPGPLICDFLSREASRGRYAPGVEFQIGRIDMVANTGTYVDAPFHRYADGKDLSQLAARAARGSRGRRRSGAPADGRAIDRAAFVGRDLGGKAVLVRTGWDVHWRTPTYLDGNPFLTGEAAAYLVSRGRRARRHRLAQHRRHQGPGAPGALDAAGRRDPDRRAPLQPGIAARIGFPLLGGAGEGGGVRDLAGAGVRESVGGVGVSSECGVVPSMMSSRAQRGDLLSGDRTPGA